MENEKLDRQSAGSTTGAGHVLTIEGLCRSFGARQVVRSLDLAVAVGERVALCGPNGSGKTTILRCVAGTLTPPPDESESRGTRLARFRPDGSPVSRSLRSDPSTCACPGGKTSLSSPVFAGTEPGRRGGVDSLGEELELEPILAERVDRCSTGMVQQLAFARALLGEPALLLLDEPTRSLDRDALERFWACLDRRPETGLVIATHNEDDVERCQQRIESPLAEPSRR